MLFMLELTRDGRGNARDDGRAYYPSLFILEKILRWSIQQVGNTAHLLHLLAPKHKERGCLSYLDYERLFNIMSETVKSNATTHMLSRVH